MINALEAVAGLVKLWEENGERAGGSVLYRAQ